MRCETLPQASCDRRILALSSKPKLVRSNVYRTEQFCLETSLYEYQNTFRETIPRLLIGFQSLSLNPDKTLLEFKAAFRGTYHQNTNERQDPKFGIGLYDFQKEEVLPATLEYYANGFFVQYDDFMFFEVSRNPESPNTYDISVNAKPNCYTIIDDPEEILVDSFNLYQNEAISSEERIDYLLSLHNRLNDRERLLSSKIWLNNTSNPESDPLVFEFYLDMIYEKSGPVLYLGTGDIGRNYLKYFEVNIHVRSLEEIIYRIGNFEPKPQRFGTYQRVKLISHTKEHVDVFGLSLDNLREWILSNKKSLCQKMISDFKYQLRKLGFEAKRAEIL